ncbi:MAG: alkaline phosphatase family protein [Planctomycetota bacterium]
MNRRTLLKSALATFAGFGLWKPKKLMARECKPLNGPLRIVVFAADALRIDTAIDLRNEGAPGLSALSHPICSLAGGGFSVTQPGWASIWSGMPCIFHKAYHNALYDAMPDDYHIMKKFMLKLRGKDFFAGWVTGKGDTIKGNIEKSPHYQVYSSIMNGHLGVYHGDTERENSEVFDLAATTLGSAVQHENFCCFIHFRDPDYIGHQTLRYNLYLDRARQVDFYIATLMSYLPAGTDILYCSDHGFNFVELGEVYDSHHYAPRGMLATNFETEPCGNITRETVGRLIYTRGGGDPDHCFTKNHEYAMYGVDI